VPDDPRKQTADIRRPERFYPKDGLVLRVTSRDMPRPADNSTRNRSQAGDWLIFPARGVGRSPWRESDARHSAGKNVPVPFAGRERLDSKPAKQSWWKTAWNQDYAWFTKAEARQFLPPVPQAGRRRDVPVSIIHRIACAHLVDNVRGRLCPKRGLAPSDSSGSPRNSPGREVPVPFLGKACAARPCPSRRIRSRKRGSSWR